MTTLSAASPRERQHPLFDTGALAPEPNPAGAGLPPHLPPHWALPALAADDLPQGRILLVENDAALARALEETLRGAGYRTAGPAVTLPDIQRRLESGSIACAILDLEVDRRTPLPVADLLDFAEVPFVLLTEAGRAALPWRHARRPRVRKPVVADELLAAIRKALQRPGAAGLRAAVNDNRFDAPPPAAPWPRVFPPL